MGFPAVSCTWRNHLIDCLRARPRRERCGTGISAALGSLGPPTSPRLFVQPLDRDRVRGSLRHSRPRPLFPSPLRVLPVPAKFRTRRRGRRHPRRPRPGEDRQVTTVAGRVATEVKPEPFRARERGRDLFSRASSAQPLIPGRSTSEWPPSGRACPAHPRAIDQMACLYSRPSRSAVFRAFSVIQHSSST